MKSKKARMIAASAAALSLLVLAGCTGGGEAAEKSESSEMGVWGYVASEKYAQLELSEDQTGAEALMVDRVLAPEDAWIVVHVDDNGQPGDRVGLAAVDEGATRDIRVELDEFPGEKVIVAVHADRGEDDEFDFDMMQKEMSPDRPFFVDGKELARVVKLRDASSTTETTVPAESTPMME